MARRVLALVAVAALSFSILGGPAPATAQEELFPYVTVNVAPEGAQVLPGEHFEGAEFDNSRPLSEGAVGPLPVFAADDGFGCDWSTAAASGVSEWIGLAVRGGAFENDPCSFFQTKITLANLFGADALIVVNNAPGFETGLAVARIPGMMIDQTEGERLRKSLNPQAPEAVKVTLELLPFQG